VYLLGATLCELLTGRAPHLAASLSEALAHASSGALPSLEGAPADLAELCRRAMAAAPADRFASVHEFKTALHRSLRQRGTLALHEQAMQRLSLLERGDAPDAPGLFVECRFGFEQVRRQWPDFSPARDGLHRTLVAMAWHELKKGSVVAARGLYGQLEVPYPDLQLALSAAESLEREKHLRLEALEAGVREASTEAARDGKALFAGGFAIFVALGSWGLQVLMWQRAALLTSRHGAMLMSVFGVSSLVYQWMVRRSPDVNQQQRRIAGALGTTWLNSVVLWVIAASWELPFMQTVALYQLVNTVPGRSAPCWPRRARGPWRSPSSFRRSSRPAFPRWPWGSTASCSAWGSGGSGARCAPPRESSYAPAQVTSKVAASPSPSCESRLTRTLLAPACSSPRPMMPKYQPGQVTRLIHSAH
jgi:hypothetical protein